MDDLDNVFAAYRETLPDLEPSAAFTPGVWQRIESRRAPIRFLRRMTQVFVTLAAAVALVLGLFVIPKVQSWPVYSASYIDVLDAEQSSDTMAYSAVIQPGMDFPNR